MISAGKIEGRMEGPSRSEATALVAQRLRSDFSQSCSGYSGAAAIDFYEARSERAPLSLGERRCNARLWDLAAKIDFEKISEDAVAKADLNDDGLSPKELSEATSLASKALALSIVNILNPVETEPRSPVIKHFGNGQCWRGTE